MHIIEFAEKGIRKYIPAEVLECDTTQYIEMSSLIFQYQFEGLSYKDFRITAFYRLLEMKAVNIGKYDLEKFSNINQYSQLIDTFFEEDTRTKEKKIKKHYIHNPKPKSRGSLRYYYGPADEFNNVSFGEYFDALEAFNDFNDTGETDYLLRLLAILYRKRVLFKKDFDIRQDYDPKKVERRMRAIRFQDKGIIYGCYLWFASFQKYLATAILYIEGKEIDLSVLFSNDGQKQKESKLPGLGMRSVLFSMAESGIFGNLEETRKASMWDVLLRLYDIVKRNADQKANENTK